MSPMTSKAVNLWHNTRQEEYENGHIYFINIVQIDAILCSVVLSNRFHFIILYRVAYLQALVSSIVSYKTSTRTEQMKCSALLLAIATGFIQSSFAYDFTPRRFLSFLSHSICFALFECIELALV